jgi:hypothetical protein
MSGLKEQAINKDSRSQKDIFARILHVRNIKSLMEPEEGSSSENSGETVDFKGKSLIPGYYH